MFTMIEGYFKGEGKGEEAYPMVRPRTKKWLGRAEFLANLELVEASKKVEVEAYKGQSKCRVCGERNGNEEYSLVMGKMRWVWPAGFKHYVEEHNCRPSLAFQLFINQYAETLK